MVFSIALIILLGLGGDYLFRRLKLPGLVGMLLVGVLVGPYVFNLISPATMAVSGDFRKIALIVILLGVMAIGFVILEKSEPIDHQFFLFIRGG